MIQSSGTKEETIVDTEKNYKWLENVASFAWFKNSISFQMNLSNIVEAKWLKVSGIHERTD